MPARNLISRAGEVTRGASWKWSVGFGETLCTGICVFDVPFDLTVSACLRRVADLGAAGKAPVVSPGGACGRRFAPHTTDQVDAYLDGSPHCGWFSDASIQQHGRATSVLEP